MTREKPRLPVCPIFLDLDVTPTAVSSHHVQAKNNQHLFLAASTNAALIWKFFSRRCVQSSKYSAGTAASNASDSPLFGSCQAAHSFYPAGGNLKDLRSKLFIIWGSTLPALHSGRPQNL